MSEAPEPNGRERRMVGLALLFYVPMLATAPWVRAPAGFRVDDAATLALGLGLAGLAGAGVVVFSTWVGRHTGWGRALRLEFAAVLGSLGSGQILLLSLLSAFGEEILFRGVLQGWLGLWPTAALFGLFHFPYRRRLVPWTLFALVLGAGLGGLTLAFHSLWPPILLHFVVNYFNIHDLVSDPRAVPTPPSEV